MKHSQEDQVTWEFIIKLFIAQFDAAVDFLNTEGKFENEKLEDFIIYVLKKERGTEKDDPVD